MTQILSIIFTLFIGSCLTCIGIILLARFCVWWESTFEVNDRYDK